MTLGERILDLFASSVIVQGILTIGVTAVVCYMAILQIAIPEQLWTLLGLAWGFYFGTKFQQSVNVKARNK